MIIKNFLSKLQFNYYTLIIIFIYLITGLIKEISAVLLLIIFHEFGHYLLSYIYEWNIDKIVIYPFGGIIYFDDLIDKPLKEELLITLGGPLNQLFIFIIYYYLYRLNIVSEHFFFILKNYNYYILLFNLIPIIPLDGSKILNIIFNKIFCFKKSYYLLIIISIIETLVLIYFIKDNYSYYIMIITLVTSIYLNYKKRNYIFNRFILEKYLYNNNYKKYHKINSINKMKRNKKHIFIYKNSQYTEKEFIKKIKGV